MSSKTDHPIKQLENQLRADWPNLRKARELAISRKQELSKALHNKSYPDTSIVVFGSLGRNEFTEESDIDWTLLIDGRTQAKHYPFMREIADVIKVAAKKKVGKEGTFGSMAFSHDILHRIGGDDDTNKNTTQRILLLLESAAINDNSAWSRVISEVLIRYITEDSGLLNKEDTIPRFLLNDIVRYWRTMCVDFAYKRRKGRGKGWGLRTIKLRLSRKLIYVSGLLACYSCELDQELKGKIRTSNAIDSQNLMIDNLASIIKNFKPLDLLSKVVLENKSLYTAGKLILDSYDEFMSILNSENLRKHLDDLTPEASRNDREFEKAKAVGQKFQDGLNKLFLEENDTPLFSLTKKYGVF